MPTASTSISRGKCRFLMPSARTLRVLLCAAAVVSLGMLLFSSKWATSASWKTVSRHEYRVTLNSGLLDLSWFGPSYGPVGGPTPRRGLNFTMDANWSSDVSMAWRPYHIAAAPGFSSTAPIDHHGFAFPLWLVVLPSIIGAAYTHGVIVGGRRADRTRCAGCGYSRTGLAAGAACPECGAAPGARGAAGNAPQAASNTVKK